MGEPLSKKALDTAHDPVEITKQSFSVERRGFDQRQVLDYLRAVAESLEDAQRREAEMRTRLGKAIRRAEAAEKAARKTPTDNREMPQRIGDEVASVLEAARTAGDLRLAEATAAADRIRRKAEARARKILAEADAVLEVRSEEAEAAATDLLAEGREEARAIRDRAQVESNAMLERTAERVERARMQCDAMIREAEEARGQILEDMERRRRHARAQVERLRVGRDRLLRSYDVVRRTLDETTVELKSSLQEAKVRGDSAARGVIAEPAATRQQLEAELRDAKMIGRITISEPPPMPPPTPMRRTAATKSTDDGAKSVPSSATERALRSPALPRPLGPNETAPGAPAPPSPSDDVSTDATAERATDSPPTPRRPKVAGAKRRSLPRQPKAPASAPTLTPRQPTPADKELAKDPIAAMMEAAEARRAGTAAPVPASATDLDPDQTDGVVSAGDQAVDPELDQLQDHDLNVVAPSDEIEQVVALSADGVPQEIFDALREQRATSPRSTARTKPASRSKNSPSSARSKEEKRSKAKKRSGQPAPADIDEAAAGDPTEPQDPTAATPADAAPSDAAPPDAAPADVGAADATSSDSMPADRDALEAQRDAIVAEAARQIEKRLTRALADEQNALLTGIRSAKRTRIELVEMVGDPDVHLTRYVVALHDVAATTYGAGAALIDLDAERGALPAGAVEELLEADLIGPIRRELEVLGSADAAADTVPADVVRSFYRRRKSDHVAPTARRLAHLLCVAGVCGALPDDAEYPFAPQNEAPSG